MSIKLPIYILYFYFESAVTDVNADLPFSHKAPKSCFEPGLDLSMPSASGFMTTLLHPEI